MSRLPTVVVMVEVVNWKVRQGWKGPLDPAVWNVAVTLAKTTFLFFFFKQGHGSDIYSLVFHLHECQKEHLIVMLGAEFGMIFHCAWCLLHCRMWNTVSHSSHWDYKKCKHQLLSLRTTAAKTTENWNPQIQSNHSFSSPLKKGIPQRLPWRDRMDQAQ